MPLQEREHPAAAHLAELLSDRRDAASLVLLPDDVSRVGDALVAGFRPDAQDLRVAALERGIPVEIALPAGTRAGQYTEHAADWVLPLVLGVPAGVVTNLIATHLQRRLDAWRAGGSTRTPTVRYREAIGPGPDGPARIREIEGPVDEVLQWLREARDATSELESGDSDT